MGRKRKRNRNKRYAELTINPKDYRPIEARKPLPHVVNGGWVECTGRDDCPECGAEDAALAQAEAEYGPPLEPEKEGGEHSKPLSEEAEAARLAAIIDTHAAETWNREEDVKPAVRKPECPDYPKCPFPCPVCEPRGYAAKLAGKDPRAVTEVWDTPFAKATVNTSTAGSYYTAKAWCRHKGKEPSLVFPDGRKVYGAQLGESLEWPSVDLVIDCADSKAEGIICPPGFEELAKHYLDFPTIYLPWRDRQAPPVAFQFWLDLYAKLPARTLACCIGSHGRTGTALAALLLASDPGLSAATAIKMIRKSHCQEAIETEPQEKYLAEFAEWINARILKAAKAEKGE